MCIKEQERKLRRLKMALEEEYDRNFIMTTCPKVKNLLGTSEEIPRIYFGVYSKGDKHEWGQIKMTYCYYEPLYVKDYRTVASAILSTEEEVIEFFARYMKKKGKVKAEQLALF